MKNKKVFAGNLNFQITEEEVRNLFSKFGAIVSIKINRKKGFAIVEMGDAAEAAKAIEKLQGVMLRDRELRLSPEMRAGKAKSITIQNYKKRSDKIYSKKKKDDTDPRSRRQKQRDTVKSNQTEKKDRDLKQNIKGNKQSEEK